MIEGRQQEPVENAVDAGVGSREGVDVVCGEDESPCDDSNAGCAYTDEEVLHAEPSMRGKGEERNEQQVGVLFYGERPCMGDAADVVLDVEQIAPELMNRAMAREQVGEEEDVVLWPDLEAATNEEALAVNFAILLPFLDEETADEKAAEDEEYVHPSPAEVTKAEPEKGSHEDGFGRVEVHDHEDGDAADEVEFDLSTGGP